MSFPDLSFVPIARELEVEAVDGGRALSELTLDPGVAVDGEDAPVLGRSVDDAEEIQERTEAVKKYQDYARMAFRQRGLPYPFQATASGDSLEVLPGAKPMARRTAELSLMVGKGNEVAEDFEKTAFNTLQALAGGWGVCTGHPRKQRGGPEKAIRRFRELLDPWETGDEWPAVFNKSGDHGADGFVVLGRSWGGPIFFFQAKNVNFGLKGFPEEFGRMSEVLNDWFGKRMNRYRRVVPVLAVNTVLTLENKAAACEATGEHGLHFIDAVDILCLEFGAPGHRCRKLECIIF